MKSLVVLFVALVVLQTSYAQTLRAVAPSIIGGIGGCGCGCGCGCGAPALSPIISSPIISSPMISPAGIPATIIQSNSVAASLADTLSLLTVSSLLADTLPLAPNVVTVAPSCGCGYGGLGLGVGYGCGCNGCSGCSGYYY